MNITRHNYEEFFLLYVDKELSAADRKAVDVFVMENPDLQMELTLLQQTIVNADDIILQKKDWLYREEGISALQESLLLYTDDELSATDKNLVESILKTNLTAIAEFNMLQQTKLQPDMDVVFEDKVLLYREEAGRVVGFKWWRVAAAAVLLGFGIWTSVSVYKNNFQRTSGSPEFVKDNKVKPAQGKAENIVDQKEIAPAVDNTLAENNRSATNKQGNTQTQSAPKNTTSAEKIITANNQGSVTSNQNVTQQNSNIKKPDNNLPKPYLENINNNTGNKTTVKNVQSENNNIRVSGSNDAVVKINPKENQTTVADINNSKVNTTFTATQVANTNTASEGEDDNSYLDVDNNKTKRTALGGFIRKAKRVLERTANVKTGEGIKIAGFEIALK